MQISVQQAVAQLQQTTGSVFTTVMQHGSMVVELYKPDRIDLQQPHEQDELYVVISGTGEFLNGETKTAFQPGDVLFVQAGVVHRFENFTPDFSTWVIFYGPNGGEAPH
ncbi:cupin domain-containing protein [Larkinella punicea]|uniref:Cupin domain-containing protein n=1 Tax=Larkinella punicea TaxID=2315727 RepID=A0A368JHN3_9BACT|nr:cupin domain-containing protein [Larkinella punicea]RCR65601.1 cupin domain-containing protein [Larkinella punicea]